MKKIIVFMLAIVLTLTLVSAVACNKTQTIRVTVYKTLDDSPKVYNHQIGENDMPELTNGNMVFDGWYYDKEFNKEFDPVADTEITDGTVIYAKWISNEPQPEQVTLTLDPNHSGEESTTVTIDKGTTYSLTTPTRDGYKFLGWFDQATNGTQYTSSTPINADTTLYAQWEEVILQPQKVELVLTPNYGDEQPQTELLDVGATYTLQPLTRDGYTFDGWYDLLGNKYEGSIIVNNYTILIARWTAISQQPEQVTLTLNLNYTGAATPTTTTLNKGATYSLTTPTRSGYTFDGWYDQATGGTKYTSSTAINADTTLYAHWTEIVQPEQVTLTLNLNYTGAAAPTTVTLNKGDTYSLTIPARSGYTFDGWYDQVSGGTKYTSSTAINSDTTLYAHWTENNQGGTTVDISSVLQKYTDNANWNFADTVTVSSSESSYSDYYEHLGYLVLNRYEDEDGNTYTDYYDLSGDIWYAYSVDENGAYVKYGDEDEAFYELYGYTSFIESLAISGYEFTASGNDYSAKDPSAVGQVIFGNFGESASWTSVTVTIVNGNITKIVGVLVTSDDSGSETATYTHTFSKHGSISFTLPNVGSQGDDPTTDKVTLTLNLNYTGAPSATTVTINKGATYSLTTPTRSGYTFDGWYTQATGGTKYTSSTAINEDTTLYAHWTENSQGSTGSAKEQFLTSVVSQPQEGESYYVAMYYALPDKVYYGVNSISGKRLFSTETKSEATVATIENTTGGFYIKLGTQYLSLSSSSQVSLTSSASTVFHIGENNILIATYSGAEYTLGSYQSGSDTTLFTYFGVSKASFSTGTNASKVDVTQFPVRLVTLDGSVAPIIPMENQIYDADSFSNSNLQDAMLKEDGAIGLPSTGIYNALVIPVQFQNDNITDAQLLKLDKAFNGNSTTTGWESVKSYYEKSSYGNLKLSFDIQPVFQASQTAAYYQSFSQNVNVGGQTWKKDGSALLLEQALAWCVDRGIDLSQYDTNNDGCIDAVYLIYSEDVDYTNADFYWAYVTWYYGSNTYGELEPYFYLFAGFDFMDENLNKMPGVTVNAETYIHETGHLLGLDDYYDYDENSGSNQGLGGADMMDYNVGDHGVYSKIMLGWITPEIVTSTQTITIKSSQAQEGNRVILIPLNWNNSYFCEYLLIDLYTATGLNEMGSQQTNSILYKGAQYGVRIYHVSSSINNPYSDDYGSFTDNNNSVSSIPLIKLVEADGKTSSSTSGSWASANDLWQAGQSFNNVFPQYTRNDGKLLNFNITIGSVSAEEATITITYNTSAAA